MAVITKCRCQTR